MGPRPSTACDIRWAKNAGWHQGPTASEVAVDISLVDCRDRALDSVRALRRLIAPAGAATVGDHLAGARRSRDREVVARCSIGRDRRVEAAWPRALGRRDGARSIRSRYGRSDGDDRRRLRHPRRLRRHGHRRHLARGRGRRLQRSRGRAGMVILEGTSCTTGTEVASGSLHRGARAAHHDRERERPERGP